MGGGGQARRSRVRSHDNVMSASWPRVGNYVLADDDALPPRTVETRVLTTQDINYYDPLRPGPETHAVGLLAWSGLKLNVGR